MAQVAIIKPNLPTTSVPETKAANRPKQAPSSNDNRKEQQREDISKISTELTQDDGQRKIGRWFIRETLGKGGYSWVKKGVDRKNGRIVALKFMERRLGKDNEWKKSQQQQIKNEIETLKMLRHGNIVRLLAYNLNAKYPDRNGRNRDVILLVLEYAAGGELFDILYYTEKLEPILARTYFRQLVAGLECMHNHGIVHRDIKPQNLLLDHKYNLKITDFGLSKIDPTGNSDILMNEWHVGTRGYQAPEILLRQKAYTKKVDIFAMGVVLFILLGGYPPFEHARETDKWYQFIVHKKYKNFWKSHRNCGLKQAETDLITRMICYDPNKRISLEKIKKHPWFTNKEILESSDLIKVLKYRHARMEMTRHNDPNKQKILQHSMKRPLTPALKQKLQKIGLDEHRAPPQLPPNELIHIYDIYTSIKINPYEVLEGLKSTISEHLKGEFIRPDFNEVFDDRYDDDEKDDDKFDGIYIDVHNFSLAFKCAVADLEAFSDTECVYINISMYRVNESQSNLVKFTNIGGVRGDTKDNKQSDTKEVTRGDTKAFLTIVRKLSDLGGQWLSGLDKKVAKNINVTMEDERLKKLYKKCFPSAETSKKETTNNGQPIQ